MYLKNIGISSSLKQDESGIHSNEVKWDADYDGNKSSISLDLNQDGKHKHYNLKLTNEDLENILGVGSVDKPIDKRLVNDFLEYDTTNQNDIRFIENNVIGDDFDNNNYILYKPVYLKNDQVKHLPIRQHIIPIKVQYRIRPKTTKSKSPKRIGSSKSRKFTKSVKSIRLNNKTNKSHKKSYSNRKTQNNKSKYTKSNTLFTALQNL